jgi:hypothetical protein
MYAIWHGTLCTYCRHNIIYEQCNEDQLMAREKQFNSEKDVKREVRKILDREDWFWWMPPANAFGMSGISDFHALKDSVFMAIETKFGKNEPTAQQIGFLNSVRSTGGFAFVVTEKRLDFLDRWIRAYAESVRLVRSKQKIPDEIGAEMINMIAELSREL